MAKKEKSILETIKDNIQKNVKGAHASVLADSDIASEREWIKTPALDLNRILSGSIFKGIPSKCLVGIVGPEHTMKSSFMVLCMVEAQKMGYTPVIIDTEGGISDVFCKRWGLNLNDALYVYTPWVEEVISTLGQIHGTGEKFIIGLDSVGGLDRLKTIQDAAKGDPKQDQGLLQKDIRRLLKLLLNICISQNSIGIACGHLYGSPGGSVPLPDQVGGGKAMRYFPRILINLKREYMREGGEKTGQIIGTRLRASTLKNHMYPPFQEALVDIDYQSGIDPYAGLFNIAKDTGYVVQSGSWFEVAGEKVQGADNAAKLLFEDMADTLLKELDDVVAKTGYSTVNREIEAAEELIKETSKKSEKEPQGTSSRKLNSTVRIKK
jgi:RecA/RadA recombinase